MQSTRWDKQFQILKDLSKKHDGAGSSACPSSPIGKSSMTFSIVWIGYHHLDVYQLNSQCKDLLTLTGGVSDQCYIGWIRKPWTSLRKAVILQDQ